MKNKTSNNTLLIIITLIYYTCFGAFAWNFAGINGVLIVLIALMVGAIWGVLSGKNKRQGCTP